MSESLAKPELLQLSPELIHKRTGFELMAIFPDFADSGRISPDLHEERERLSSIVGEDRVLTSMYVDKAGEVQLGLFVKPDEALQEELAKMQEIIGKRA